MEIESPSHSYPYVIISEICSVNMTLRTGKRKKEGNSWCLGVFTVLDLLLLFLHVIYCDSVMELNKPYIVTLSLGKPILCCASVVQWLACLIMNPLA